MFGDSLVVDAVAHGYNLRQDNVRNDIGTAFVDGTYGAHLLMTPPGSFRLDRSTYLTDWSATDLEEVYVLESDVDVVAYHGLPLDDFFLDGFSALSKGLELRARHPLRVFVYAPVNPLLGPAALDEVDRLADLGVDALKLYPARYVPGGPTQQIRLDDPKFGRPLIEKALSRGISTIAVHKAIPLVGPAAYFGVEDVDYVAMDYPEMRFEIVHAGFAFLEDTYIQLSRFSNVFANLESTSSLACVRPRRFAEILGNFLYHGGEDRVMYATGCSLVHPQPGIDALRDFTMPADLVEDGFPIMTDSIKAKVLGTNFLRLHGVDPDVRKAALAGDAWSKRREEAGRQPAYHLKAAAVSTE
jgi:predicted TIM-barrel fold metal-dependent hydrolase